jgi:hypothetical protein
MIWILRGRAFSWGKRITLFNIKQHVLLNIKWICHALSSKENCFLESFTCGYYEQICLFYIWIDSKIIWKRLLNFAKRKSSSSWEQLSSSLYDQKIWNCISFIGRCKTYFQCTRIHFELSCYDLFSIFNEENIDIKFNNSSNLVCNPYRNVTDFKQSKKLVYNRSVSNLDWKHDQMLHHISYFELKGFSDQSKLNHDVFRLICFADSVYQALSELHWTNWFWHQFSFPHNIIKHFGDETVSFHVLFSRISKLRKVPNWY